MADLLGPPFPQALAAPLRAGLFEGCMLLGPDWTLLQLTPCVPGLSPRSLDALLGRALPDLDPDLASRAAFAHYRKALAAGQPRRFETVLALEAGPLGFEVQAVPVPEGLSVLALTRPAPRTGDPDQPALALERAALAAELARTLEAHEAFVHAIAHDLRAPLRHITGFADLLAAQEGPQLSDRARRQLATIQRAAGTQAALLDEFLVFDGWGRQPLRPVSVDLRALALEVMAALPAEAREPGLSWELGPLPRVRADHALLGQALNRLLTNAVLSTRPHLDSRIELGCREEAAEWVVFVRDDGIGFNPGQGHRLFGLFQKLHADPRFEGLGMGLAHVRRIIQRHGGRTWAESDGARGATFSFSLPK